MKDGKIPDPNTIYPIAGYDKEIYIKPTIKNPSIIVGDFSYIADSDFESHVTHHYDFIGDKLIIGKFCQISAGVEFIMNGANHQRNAATTFPFYTLEGWEQTPPSTEDLELKGDTIIGNDVWIGQNAVILPGVHIGDGAIIGANSVVRDNVGPYTVVIGNPSQVLRKRFDDELVAILEEFKWWNKSIKEINSLIPLLTSNDLETLKKELKEKVQKMKKCPKCGEKLIEIIYGMPSSDLFKAEERGEVILGGCCLSGDDPKYHCKNCNLDYSRDLKKTYKLDPGVE